MSDFRLGIRVAPALALLVLCLILPACGDSDSGAASGGGTQQTAGDEASNGDETPVPESAERKLVVKAKKQLVDNLYAANAAAYCAGLTEHAASKLAGKSTCEKTIRGLVPAPMPPAVRATYRERVVSATVDGDEAVIVSRGIDGGKDRATFVKEDGEWKLDREKLSKQQATDRRGGAAASSDS
jgi:hypothetical protein